MRSHLQQTIDNLDEGIHTGVQNLGGWFRKQVFGSPRKRALLKAAMGNAEYTRFENLMKVLEASGVGLKGQSMTQPRQVLAANIEKGATPFVNKLSSPYAWLTGKLKDSNLDKVYNTLVDVAMQPSTGMDFNIDRALRSIKKYQGFESPPRDKYLQTVWNVILQAAAQGAQNE